MSDHEHHERVPDAPDPDALTTATVGIVGTLLVVIVVVFTQGLYESANQREFEKKVVSEAPAEIRSLRAAQQARLHASSWVDKKNGFVTIPIEKSMELLAADPNPAAPIVLPALAEVPAATSTAAAAAQAPAPGKPAR